MSRFRKKPVEIEAIQFISEPDGRDNGGYVAKWCGGRYEPYGSDGWIIIPTLEGNMRADVGDWIIRGVAGEFYPCKPDIFEQTYEPVSDE